MFLPLAFSHSSLIALLPSTHTHALDSMLHPHSRFFQTLTLYTILHRTSTPSHYKYVRPTHYPTSCCPFFSLALISIASDCISDTRPSTSCIFFSFQSLNLSPLTDFHSRVTLSHADSLLCNDIFFRFCHSLTPSHVLPSACYFFL